MSILSGYKKVKDRILTSSGYQLLSRWTSSNTVDFDDGKTAQTKVGAINGIIKDKNSLSTVTDDSFAAGAVAVKDAIADVNGKLNQNTDLSLVNCVSWDSENTISKIGNRVFVTLGVRITSEQYSGSLIIANIGRTYSPKNMYVRTNAVGGTSGDNHILYIDKSSSTIILNPSTERYYSASFSYLSD